MKIAILGTGMVGNTIGAKLIELGHEVKMGSRTADNEKAVAFVQNNGPLASAGTFADAAAFGEVIFNCTSGGGAIEALTMAGPAHLNGKVLIDVSNPLDFSKGMPPTLLPQYCNTTSVAEEIQKTFPGAKVVKAFNTMNCRIMVNAAAVSGDSDLFMCGNDDKAKTEVKEIAGWFGWKNPVDLGDLTAARGMEMMVILWVRVMQANQGPDFNFRIVK